MNAMEPEQQDWQQTLGSLTEQASLMDAIHEAHPGKENRQLRDELCRPHRSICVRLHYRRIELVRLASQENARLAVAAALNVPVTSIDEKAVARVLTGMLAAFDAKNVAAYQEFSQTPAAQEAVQALRKGDFDRFYFALQYPVNQIIEGLLASEFPGEAHDVRFLFEKSQFVENHIRRLVEKHEGTVCCADKTRSVMRSILRYLTTGKEIAFDYTQEYTFHLPKRVFTEHAVTLQFFKSLQDLYSGNPEPYMQALLAVHTSASLHTSPSPNDQ